MAEREHSEDQVGLYDHLLPPEQARAIYILKGGPGCGKSTLMRRVGAWAEEAGLKTEYILCSGDPDSLDGLILPGKAVAPGRRFCVKNSCQKYISGIVSWFCFWYNEEN